MAGHGGRRSGAGRKAKPRIEAPADGQEFFDEQCRNILPDLFPRAKEMAMGVKIGVYAKAPPREAPDAEPLEDERGRKVWVYTLPPDKTMLQYMIDRALGKAATQERQQKDLTVILQCDVPSPEGLEIDPAVSGDDGAEEALLDDEDTLD